MEVKYEQSGTPFKCDEYEVIPKDNTTLSWFVRNVEQVPSESYEETLIIEVVEDDDELITDTVDESSGRNSPSQFELIKPPHIKQDVEPEYFTFKNELGVKQEIDVESFTEEQVKDESLEAPLCLLINQDYTDEGELNTGDCLESPIKNVKRETLRKASNEDDVGVDPDYCPITDSYSDSEPDKSLDLSSYKKESSPGEKHFKCSVCTKSFSRLYHLNRHITTHTGKIPQKYSTHLSRLTKQGFSCKRCGKCFAWMRNLKSHIDKVHPEEKVETKEYQCYHCENVYRKKLLLAKHMRVHRSKKRFQCTACQESFRSAHTLKWHQVFHTMDLYSCPDCEESFTKLYTLMDHRLQFHRQDNKYPCKVCPRSFKFQSSLQKHQKEHSLGAKEDNVENTTCPDDDEGPFLCDICGESFSLMKFITRHKLSHEKPFQCEVCGNRFISQHGLRLHSLSHSDRAKFQCDVCGKRFLQKIKFVLHKKRHSQESGSYLCAACGKLFMTKGGFFKHMKMHRKKTFECHICGKYFAVAEFYHDHLKRHEKRLFKCTLCPLDFTRHEHLKSHMQKHDEEANLEILKKDQRESTGPLDDGGKFPSRSGKLKVKGKVPHRCKVCSKTYPFKSALTNHEKCHSKVESFKCPVCSKTLRTNLERHMKTHSDEKPFECSVCNKGFRVRDQLYRHMRTHAVEPPFPCSMCSKGFFSSYALALHRRVHSDGAPYQCKLCEGKFYRMSLLENHLREHTGDKPYQCDICKRRFTIKAHLGKHQKNNPEQKAFPCSDCDRQFCFEKDLTVHMKDHNGNCCSFCGKQFQRQSDLKVHIRSHTKETPYECSVCKKRFTTSSTLKRHTMQHTGEKPFVCHICGKSFRRKFLLDGHLRKVHGEGGVFEKPGRVEAASQVKKRVVIKVIPVKKRKETQ